MATNTSGYNFIGMHSTASSLITAIMPSLLFSPHSPLTLTWKNRPRNNDVTLSALRAKAMGFTALVVTLDTFLLGWRLRDLETTYLPFSVFMRRQQLAPRPDEHPTFPLDMDAFRACRAGEEQASQAFALRG